MPKKISTACDQALRLALVYLTMAILLACSSTNAGNPDQGGGEDQSVADASPNPDAADPDAADDGSPHRYDAAPAPDGERPNEIDNAFGFTMRLPQIRTVPCPEAPEDLPGLPDHLDQVDVDWICTFAYGGTEGHIYIQATPVTCTSMNMGAFKMPLFETKAVLSVGGVLSPLGGADYFWGGGHRNEEISFERDGKYFRYYHASFGFGFRACQPPNCAQIRLSPNGAIAENGCTNARTLPVVCRQVAAGESYGEADFPDTFKQCPGHMNPEG